MGFIALLLLLIFIVIMLMASPSRFGMGALTPIGFVWLKGDVSLSPEDVCGCDVYVYLCILLFILAADIMSIGGITYSIVRFCETLIDHIRGGLAHVNVMASMLFAGCRLRRRGRQRPGAIEIEMMTEGGYPRDFPARSRRLPPSSAPSFRRPTSWSSSRPAPERYRSGKCSPAVLFPALCSVCATWLIAITWPKINYPKRTHRATQGDLERHQGYAARDHSARPDFLFHHLASRRRRNKLRRRHLRRRRLRCKKNFHHQGFCRSCIRAAKSTANVLFIISSTAMGWLVTTMASAK